jgi:endonuclease I/predicted RNA-binding protein with TRAM domain
MKRLTLIFSFLLILSASFSQIPAGYYDDADGKTGYQLKTALFNIIKNPNVDSYSGLWSDFFKTDVDRYYENDGTVMDIYSEDPANSDPYNYTLGDDQCGNYSGEGSCYNREHSFPKSWFNDASPMYSDLFHIYPTDGYVNSKRSNYPYGEVSSPTWTSQNGCKLGPCSISGYSGTVFEPIDEFKGDLARTYFYMATCYEDKIASWSSDVLDGSSDKCYVDWFLNMLIQWHEQDPVSQKEIDRNDSIYTIQGNRNPFIDHPDWVECIWQNSCGDVVANPENFTATAVSSSQIDLSWSLNANNDSVVLAYNTTNTFGTPSGNYSSGDPISDGGTVLYVGTNTNFNHTGLSSQTYYYKIWSVDSLEYSTGVNASATPFLPEPSNHVTNFAVNSTTSSSITLTWTDATGATEPTAYLIKATLTGNSITNPVDGTPEADGTFAKNINQGVQTATFDGLNTDTQYDFKIFPYTNSGSNIDYKTDGTIPFVTGKTDTLPAAGDTCGYETFDGLASGSSSYSNRSWTGQDGSTWTATDARTDQNLNGSNAICIRNGYVQSGTIAGGISEITISTQRVFSGGSGNITIEINGTQVGSVPYSDAVQTSTVSNIDIAGDIVLKLSSDNSDRIVIDDIIWKCFQCNSATAPDSITASFTDICEGQSVTLSYFGGNGDTFNWYSNSCGGTYIGSGDNISVSPTSTTTYFGRWENSCSTSECKNITINVSQLAEITQQPENQSVCEGDDVTFSISATGENLTYQWQKDGADISGETQNTLTLNNITSADAGIYTCVVSGNCNNVTSNGATLSIKAPAEITEQPENQSVCEGDNVTLSITATGDDLAYQWQKNGTDLSGENLNTLTIDNVTLADAGKYTCKITACNVISSDTAIVSVTQNTTITQQPENQSVCEGENITLSITASGDNLSYQWQKDGADISGETQNTLTINNITSADAGIYTCVVSGTCNNITSDNAIISVLSNTAITEQPQDINVFVNDTAIFFVSATGDNLTFQWQKDGTDITNANNDTLYIYNVSNNDAGNYQCIVNGTCGQVTSDTAVLSLITKLYEANSHIVIAPNPNSGNFVIKNLQNQNLTNIKIIDLTGKIIYSSKITENEHQVNLKNINSGLYILKISNSSKIFYEKIIIK